MTEVESITFDLARNCGWCHGNAGDAVPVFGSLRFGSVGASHQALFGHALDWFTGLWGTIKPQRIVYEAPLHWRGGKSTTGNDEIAHGLPAVLMATAYRAGLFKIYNAQVRDVRLHFIGKNPRRAAAKRETMQRCHMLGWKVRNDNEADAVALWSYDCGLRKAEAALRPTPLFAKQA